jgi:hypothetical protein
MLNHLLSCIYCPENIKIKAKRCKVLKKGNIEDTGGEGDSDTPAGSTSSKGKCSLNVEHKQTGMKKQKSFTVVAAKGISYGPEKHITFKNQLLRAAISAGWLFNSVVDPEVIKLFHSIAPGLKIPDRTKLSNKILRREVASIEGDIQKSTKGAYATMQKSPSPKRSGKRSTEN